MTTWRGGWGEQLALLRAGRPSAARRPRRRRPTTEELPVALVQVDTAAHLDRPFDYSVPDAMADGRRARGAGQGAVRRPGPRRLPRSSAPSRDRARRPAQPAAQGRLARAGAHPAGARRWPAPSPTAYAGTLATSSAWPSRRGTPTGREGPGRRAARAPRLTPPRSPGAWRPYRPGPAFLAHVARGWCPARGAGARRCPGRDWPALLAAGRPGRSPSGPRRAARLPDHRDVVRGRGGAGSRCWGRAGTPGSPPTWAAGALPALPRARCAGTSRSSSAPGRPRSRRCTTSASSRAGTTATTCYDEPRAPYPHAREVLLARAQREGAAALSAGFAPVGGGADLVAPRWADRGRGAAPRSCARRARGPGRRRGPRRRARPGRAPRPACPPSPGAPPRRPSSAARCWCRCRGAATCPRCPARTAAGPARCTVCAGRWRCRAAGAAGLPLVRPRSRPAYLPGVRRPPAALVRRRRPAHRGGARPRVPRRAGRALRRRHVLDGVGARAAARGLHARAPSRSPTAAMPPRCCSTPGRCSSARASARARSRCAAGSAAAALVRPGRRGWSGRRSPGPRPTLDACGRGTRALGPRLVRRARARAERRELSLPPAARLAALTGAPSRARGRPAELELPATATLLGPLPHGVTDRWRTLVTVARPDGPALARELAAMRARASARKDPDPVTCGSTRRTRLTRRRDSALARRRRPRPPRLPGVSVTPIRLFGDPVLRTPAEPVVDFDAELRRLVDDLTDTMLDAPGPGSPPRSSASGCGCSPTTSTACVGHLVNPELDPRRRGAGRRRGLPVHPRPALRHPARLQVVARGFEHVRRAGHRRGHRPAGPLRAARDRPPRRHPVRRPARRRDAQGAMKADPRGGVGRREPPDRQGRARTPTLRPRRM